MERLKKALRLEKPDRVPILELGIGQRAKSAILQDYTGDCPDVELAQRVGMDVVGMGVFWSPGRVSRKASDGTDHYAGGSIKGWDDLVGLKPPDLKVSLQRLERLFEVTKGTGVGVYAYVHGPFDPLYLGMGYETFMYKLYDDYRLVEHLMDMILDYNCEAAAAICEYDLAFMMVGDDVAQKGGLMIRPDLFHEMWTPRLRRLIEPAKRKGRLLVMHSDGYIMDLMPLLIECGFNAVNPLEPCAGNDIYRAKEVYGDRICLAGNVSVSGALSFGTPEEVAADVREHIDRLAPGGGYVCGSSHSITDSVPPENYMAMIRTVQEYGRY